MKRRKKSTENFGLSDGASISKKKCEHPQAWQLDCSHFTEKLNKNLWRISLVVKGADL